MSTGKIRKLVRECILEVLQESLSEGFDPLSQAGPNSPKENPYPEWNAQMRHLEEEEESNDTNNTEYSDIEYYINNSGLTERCKFIVIKKIQGYTYEDISKMLFPHLWEFTSPNKSKRNKIHRKNTKSLIGRLFKASIEKMRTRHNRPSVRENEHGRYAQTAGAGQFDPRTFPPK